MDVTPTELRNGRWYKRDDLHVGGGGTNGAKLRACEHLVRQAVVERGARNLVTATSVRSPQHAIVANVARQYGVTSHHIVGHTNAQAAARYPSVASALAAGARFSYISSGFNVSLRPAAAKMAGELPNAEIIHYGITPAPDASTAQLRAFAEVGAGQVQSLPDDINTLVIPFGSGNSAVGILTGLHLHRRRHTLAVKLIGIGPPRLEWLVDRLHRIGVGVPDDVEHHDLRKFAKYEDRMPESRDGIDFHPTYEGKVIRYLDGRQPYWWKRRDGKTCFWIVGSPLTTPPKSV